MELGKIEISTKKSNCKECKDIIVKDRKRIKISAISKSYCISSYLHLDCYLKKLKGFEKELLINYKEVNKQITKSYLEQKNSDIIAEKI